VPLKIIPAAREATHDVTARHVLATLFHASGDTPQRELRRLNYRGLKPFES